MHPNIDTEKLDKLAEVAVRVAVNLQEGQDLVVSAPIEALPLVRRIAAVAYRLGGGLVTPLLSDDQITLARYQHGADAVFDRAEGWLAEGMALAYERGAAALSISASDPMLLADQPAERLMRANAARAVALKPVAEVISNSHINWAVISYPGAGWAQHVFPDLPQDQAIAQLSEAIFAASRVDRPDPIAAWREHSAALLARVAWLDEMRFDALHFSGPGTDLTVGLADQHAWKGGACTARNGVTCLPNIPTEEVFTTPHAARTEGRVRASKPLAYNGAVIEDIEVVFEAGRITQARASAGQEALLQLLDTDEGARRLGEVALVPHSSPISQSGVLFYSTLFDENAASHIALGRCYSDCFVDGGGGREVAQARGGNDSLIHVDWMIGSGDMAVDGIKGDTRIPVMRQGDWV